jgi:hypothetical protein
LHELNIHALISKKKFLARNIVYVDPDLVEKENERPKLIKIKK